MIDAYRNGMDVYRVNISVEILANNEDEAVDYADRRLIVDGVVNDPKFVSFDITSPRGQRVVNA